MNNEITENLLERKEEPNIPNKTNKNKKWIIIGIVVSVIILAVIGVSIYFYIQNQRNQEFLKQIELGNKYLEEGDYENAEIAFNEAITISDNREEGFIGVAKADTYLGKVNEAKEAYITAYDITDNPTYEKRASQVVYGNTNGNNTSGGSIVQQVDHTYIAETDVTESTIWEERNGEQTAIAKIPVEGSPIENLNVRGRFLYYLQNQKIYKINLTDNTTTPIEIENVIQYLILEDRIYFLSYNEEANLTSINFTDIEGNNLQKLSDLENYGFSFIVVNNVVYSVQTDYEDLNSTHLIKVDISNPNPQEIYVNEEALITGLSSSEDKIYFKLTTPEAYAPSLYTLDINSNEVSELIQPGSVESINIDDDNIYYVSNNELYKSNLNGDNPELISQITNQQTTDYYKYPLNTINITTNNVYVINSLSNSIYDSVGLKNEVLTASNENTEPLQGIDLSGNTEELIDPEPPIPKAYEIIIDEFRTALNGGTTNNPDANNFADTFRGANNIGYTIIDLDENGTDELLIGMDYNVTHIFTLVESSPYFIASAYASGLSLALTYDNYIRSEDLLEVSVSKLVGTQLEEIYHTNLDGHNYDYSQEKYPAVKIDWTYFN